MLDRLTSSVVVFAAAFEESATDSVLFSAVSVLAVVFVSVLLVVASPVVAGTAPSTGSGGMV